MIIKGNEILRIMGTQQNEEMRLSAENSENGGDNI